METVFNFVVSHTGGPAAVNAHGLNEADAKSCL